jgi:hypothetical protein
LRTTLHHIIGASELASPVTSNSQAQHSLRVLRVLRGAIRRLRHTNHQGHEGHKDSRRLAPQGRARRRLKHGIWHTKPTAAGWAPKLSRQPGLRVLCVLRGAIRRFRHTNHQGHKGHKDSRGPAPQGRARRRLKHGVWHTKPAAAGWAPKLSPQPGLRVLRVLRGAIRRLRHTNHQGHEGHKDSRRLAPQGRFRPNPALLCVPLRLCVSASTPPVETRRLPPETCGSRLGAEADATKPMRV